MARGTFETTVVFRMSPDDVARVDAQATRHGLSRSDMLRMTVKRALEELERQQRSARGRRRD